MCDFRLEHIFVEGLGFEKNFHPLHVRHGHDEVGVQEGLDGLSLANHVDRVDSTGGFLRQETVENESRSEAQKLEHLSSEVTSDAFEANQRLQFHGKLAKLALPALLAGVNDVLAANFVAEHLSLFTSSHGDNWRDPVAGAQSDDHAADLG